ncbi:nicotinate-nucleotide adenylyltransferase [Seinonella peptonophila]|uniref:Probable nicotinate-nucleotide adenylyltransferase n=2 Tax=Seinonella peptonophila TaxID=112248 RepID=A0A1M4W7K7_9BACL|nr:nicotinate-nucleotide adenylyltransferase [Seinonella peptonophila]
MRIGILGGTFDPIHIGHLLMAEQALQAYQLNEVWFIPAATPPHKIGRSITAAHHRLEMVRLAVLEHPQFRVNELEYHRPGPSYTVETIENLHSIYSENDFFLIIGADTVIDLPNWYKIEKILQMTQVIGIHRPGVDLSKISPSVAPAIRWVEQGIEINISSSFIRKHIHNSRVLRYVVSERVYQYMKEYSLYED